MKTSFITLTAISLLLASYTASAENDIHYPSRAWHLDQSGEVVALYDINEAGKAENVRIEYSNPKFLFDDSVKSQIYSWKFPKGNPEKDVKLRINFQKQ